MGGTQNSFSPQARDGYTPVQMYEKDGQYYNYSSPAMGNPITIPARSLGAEAGVETRPQGTFTPINFGGGQQSANRYGTPRKYGTPSSSYRAPATYRNTPAPSYGGGHGGKGGYEAPPPRSYQQPNKYNQPKLSYKAQVPSYGGGKGGVSAPPPSYGGYGGGGQLYDGATWTPDPHPLDNPMHGKFKAPDGSVVSHRGGVGLSPSVYSSPPPALRNYANQRSSSKASVSPSPPPLNNTGFGSLGRYSPSKPKVPQNNIF